MNLNRVFILGRLTGDPQLRNTAGGQSVANFSVATNRVWTDKSGGKREEVEYHNVVVWGRQAEVASQFLTKGSLVFVEGRLQTRTWQDQQGQNRKTTEIICEKMQLGPRPAGQGNFQGRGAQAPADEPAANDLPEIDIEEDKIKPEDLPF